VSISIKNCIDILRKRLWVKNQKPYLMLRALRRNSGQAALEYVLILMISATTFGFLFWAIRITVYESWVCYMGPRIQSPAGCVKTEDCWKAIKALSAVSSPLQKSIDSQIENCTDVYNRF
jgi:hypothetical protein